MRLAPLLRFGVVCCPTVSAPQAEREEARMSRPSRTLIALPPTLCLAVLPLPPVASAGPPKPPAGSCVGVDACTGNTGGLGTNACVGDRACFDNSGNINQNACNGPLLFDQFGVCESNTGSVGVGACQGEVACIENEGQ